MRSVSHRYGSFHLFFPPLLPSISAFFKFSPYNQALYTIKPSLTPPLRQLPVSDLETQVICHQRGELDETASPAWELHIGPGSSHCCSTESLNIVKQSSRELGMEKWCQCVSDCVSVLLPHCLFLKRVRVCSGLHVLAWFCFLSGRSLTRDKGKVKAERTADRISSAYTLHIHPHTKSTKNKGL